MVGYGTVGGSGEMGRCRRFERSGEWIRRDMKLLVEMRYELRCFMVRIFTWYNISLESLKVICQADKKILE